MLRTIPAHPRFLISSLVALSLLGTSCGDDFGTSYFGQVGVLVDDSSHDPDDPIIFLQALQLPVSRKISLRNVGGIKSLVNIKGIAWAKDEDTQQELRNKYIELDFLGGANGDDTFPREISAENFETFTFEVVYTPPLGMPLDDFSDSVLVITTDAADSNGRDQPEIRLTFRIESDTPYPRVTPVNFTFNNATPTSPESQQITIYNDEQLGNGQFSVLSIRLETQNPEFVLSQLPSDGAVVLGRNDDGYADLKFLVTYTPTDNNPDTNAIIITTDATTAPILRVSLSTDTNRGSYELTFDDPTNEFDFTNVSQPTTRNAFITSLGPGPITIRAPGPTVEPAEARPNYTVKAYIPATTEDGEDTLITGWPRALQSGKGIRIEVEYKPIAGEEPANGELIIPYGDPDAKQIVIPLFAGDPKSKIVLGPSIGSISVTGDILAADTGSRYLIIYNEGNGPLQVNSLTFQGAFGPGDAADVWSLVGPSAPFEVEPGGIELVELSYALAEITSADGHWAEAVIVDYVNDFIGADATVQMSLIADNDDDLALPVANIGAVTGAVAGTEVTLSGAASTAGGGAFEGSAYVWNVTAKPAGSYAKLNTSSGPTVGFVPDVAGSYTVQLVVYAKATEDLFLYSVPVTSTFTVTAP